LGFVSCCCSVAILHYPLPSSSSSFSSRKKKKKKEEEEEEHMNFMQKKEEPKDLKRRLLSRALLRPFKRVLELSMKYDVESIALILSFFLLSPFLLFH